MIRLLLIIPLILLCRCAPARAIYGTVSLDEEGKNVYIPEKYIEANKPLDVEFPDGYKIKVDKFKLLPDFGQVPDVRR